MNLRVTLVSYDDDPPLGGQGVMVRGLRAGLQRRGVQVTTVAGRGDHAVTFPPLLHRPPLDLSLDLNRHPQRLLAGDPHVVHVMGGPGGVLLLRSLGVPVVYTANHTYRQAHAVGRLRRLPSLLERRAYARAAAVLPISPSTADAVRALGVPRPRIEVVAPGVDVERLDRGEQLRQPGRLLFVGRLEPHKGPLLAVVAMAQLARTRPEVRGVVIGTGSQDSAVRAAAAASGGAVEMLGPLDDDALAAEYARADLVLIPSRYEGLGLVALEAMAAGAVVIAGDVDGLRDAVGDRGLLVSPSDGSALAAASAALLDDRQRRDELASRARDHVRRHHSWDAVAARVEAVYRKVLGAAWVD
jgi:glycosyltransferase involved in cell wall biosynthesis